MSQNTTTKNPPSPDFLTEKTARLKVILDILNSNDRPLDELVAVYEEGMIIAKECKDYLTTIEGKIIDITKRFQDEE